MPPDELNERLAVVEEQIRGVRDDVGEVRKVVEAMRDKGEGIPRRVSELEKARDSLIGVIVVGALSAVGAATMYVVKQFGGGH